MYRLGLLALLILLVGCGTATTPTTPSVPSSAGTTSSGEGTITGIVVDEQNQPIQNIGVFLADLTPGPAENSKIISFQLHSSKRSMTDQQGRFTIAGVPAGSYSLALWTPNETVLIPQPGSAEGSAILVEVRAGQTVDLGTLRTRRPR